MTRVARHRRNLLHWLITVSLTLALVLQPTLAAIGELHEQGHGLDETHLASEGHEAVTDEVAEHGESGDRTAGLLHAIHHITHCCGQVAVPAIERLQTSVRLVHAAEPDDLAAARPASEPLLAPFRPPIHG